jgi:hypothetical protein
MGGDVRGDAALAPGLESSLPGVQGISTAGLEIRTVSRQWGHFTKLPVISELI